MIVHLWNDETEWSEWNLDLLPDVKDPNIISHALSTIAGDVKLNWKVVSHSWADEVLTIVVTSEHLRLWWLPHRSIIIVDYKYVSLWQTAIADHGIGHIPSALGYLTRLLNPTPGNERT